MSKMKSYFEKYKDPRWQKNRLKVLERESFTCQLCGTAENTLHVHHGYYTSGKDPWDYEIESLWCLCEVCHFEVECHKHDIHLEIARIHPKYYEKIFMYLRDLRFETRGDIFGGKHE